MEAVGIVVAVAAVENQSKVVPILAGLAVVVGGLALIATARPLTDSLNSLYRRLPGRVLYPPWFIPAIGAFGIAFGLLVVGLMVFVAK